MTQAWDKAGNRLPITVASLHIPQVTQVKTQEKDGYSAVQIGINTKKTLNKPQLGHIKKAGVSEKFRTLKELRLTVDSEHKPGDILNPLEAVKVGDTVKAVGVSKGKGFAGVVKRWGFAGGPRTHGQSDRLRAPGSIGQGTTPGRVYKGKKMAGRMGMDQLTVENLVVVKIENNNIWIKGSLPGTRGTLITFVKTGESKFPGLIEPEKPEELVTETVSETPETVLEELKTQETNQ